VPFVWHVRPSISKLTPPINHDALAVMRGLIRPEWTRRSVATHSSLCFELRRLVAPPFKLGGWAASDPHQKMNASGEALYSLLPTSKVDMTRYTRAMRNGDLDG